MLSLHEISIRLQDRNLKEVSRKSGVGYITVWRIAKTQTENINYKSVAKLSEYLEIIK